MGLKITTYADSMFIDLNGISADRTKAHIKFHDIRSIAACTDLLTVEVIFSNGEIKGFPYTAIEEFNGVAPTSQDDLYNKIDAAIFP
jgi:hypothetical protein